MSEKSENKKLTIKKVLELLEPYPGGLDVVNIDQYFFEQGFEAMSSLEVVLESREKDLLKFVNISGRFIFSITEKGKKFLRDER